MLYFSLVSFLRSSLQLFLLFVLLLLTSCGLNTSAGASTQGCGIEVSWAINYRTLKELKQATALDLAVQGTFVKTLSTDVPAQTSGNGPVSTDFSLVVGNVLLDPHHISPATIIIHQTGGLQDGRLCQVSDDPLFRVGEKSLLFLHQSGPGHYFVIGGPSGRFEVRNGFVQPVNDEGVKLPTNLTEQKFYDMLKAA